MAEKAIVIKNLKKSYKQLSVLKGINLEVEKGTVFALLGPNGAGKTTIVRILSTLLNPDEGTATINGINVVEQPNEIRGIIGLTGQYAAVDEYLNAYENLIMMGRLYHLSATDSEKRANELLAQFDLVDAAKRPVKTFSGGMRRRLDLALSMIANPPVIFLDEPTTGLDPRSRLVVWETVQQLVKTGTTIFLTTQYLEEADQLADKIAVIDGGKVIAEGTADQLKQKVGKERLELTIAKKSNFEEAIKAVGETIRVDAEKRFISLSVESDVKQLKTILDKLEKAKIDIDTLALHKPTLDDVFLKLTGHQATADAEEAKAKE
jgi:ABC-2 type transport system ATP-binding protein